MLNGSHYLPMEVELSGESLVSPAHFQLIVVAENICGSV